MRWPRFSKKRRKVSRVCLEVIMIELFRDRELSQGPRHGGPRQSASQQGARDPGGVRTSDPSRGLESHLGLVEIGVRPVEGFAQNLRGHAAPPEFGGDARTPEQAPRRQ